MKINHNITAMVTNNQLLRTEESLADTMERLASGLKINHAKDNPAGMAISNKMNTQIDGLNQAKTNASDGISVIQITDGALTEVHAMLQRMRELCVQAANDTNCDSDREAIQKEIEELKEEIDRISRDTEYNTMPLLNGNQSTRIYSKQASRINISEYVDPGDYKITVTKAAEPAGLDSTVFTTDNVHSATKIGQSGSIIVNDAEVEIDEDDTYEDVYTKLKAVAVKGDAEFRTKDENATSLGFYSKAYGNDAELTIKISNDDLAAALGFDSTVEKAGENAEISLEYKDNVTITSGFETTASYRLEGNRVFVEGAAGFKMDFLLEAGFTGDVNMKITEMGPMELQIGANQYQTVKVEIPEISTQTLYIDDLQVTSVKGPSMGIEAIDKAMEKVSLARANLGAGENRLDYSVENLATSVENMTGAYSRIMDADMAEEMVDYTQGTVLNQAGVSILGQANDLPQMVLQLLQ